MWSSGVAEVQTAWTKQARWIERMGKIEPLSMCTSPKAQEVILHPRLNCRVALCRSRSVVLKASRLPNTSDKSTWQPLCASSSQNHSDSHATTQTRLPRQISQWIRVWCLEIRTKAFSTLWKVTSKSQGERATKRVITRVMANWECTISTAAARTCLSNLNQLSLHPSLNQTTTTSTTQKPKSGDLPRKWTNRQSQ